MSIGTNIPGMYDYTLQKNRYKTPGSGPFVPTPTPTPAPSPAPAPNPVPSPVPGSPMGGYIDRQTQTTMNAKPPTTPSWLPYRPTPISPVAVATPTPQTAAPVVPAAQPVPQAQTPAPATPAATPTPTPLPKAGPPPLAGQSGSSLQDPGQITDVGKQYAGQYGAGLQDVGQMTQAGRMYADRITQNLSGNNPLVQNAQSTEDTAAARRAYAARKSTTETLAQTPFTPGSAQYQRAMLESRAGVDAANQQGQNQVNDFTRKETADNLAAANNLETQSYNRASAERTAAGNFEDQQYGRAVGERTNTQNQNTNLGDTITDPKAKYAYNAAIAAGVDPKVAYQQIVGSNGTINEQYRGQSPVQQVSQDATDWIKATTDLKEGTPEFQKAVRARMTELDAAKNQPVTEANTTSQNKAIEGKLNTNQPLSSDETNAAIQSGLIPPLTEKTLPFGSDGVQSFLKLHPSGKAAINGHEVSVVQGGRYTNSRGGLFHSNTHTDFVQLKVDGKDYWLDNQGNWFDSNPMNMETSPGIGSSRLLSEDAKKKSVKSPVA